MIKVLLKENRLILEYDGLHLFEEPIENAKDFAIAMAYVWNSDIDRLHKQIEEAKTSIRTDRFILEGLKHKPISVTY